MQSKQSILVLGLTLVLPGNNRTFIVSLVSPRLRNQAVVLCSTPALRTKVDVCKGQR